MTENPTEVTAEGYTDIDVGGKCAAWGYIEFRTEADVKIIRIATNDSRVTQSVLTSKKVTYVVALSGADSDIVAAGLPKTFSKAAFKKLDTDEAAVMASDSFSTSVTFSGSGDSANITINAGILI